MADPLSLATGVTSVLIAAAQITSVLVGFRRSVNGAPHMARTVIMEIKDLTTILSQLQDFILGRELGERTRTALLRLDHMVAIVSSCVLTFSELTALLDTVKTEDMRAIDKVKWVRRQAEVQSLTQRLNTHKISLSLVLDILNGCVYTMNPAM